MLVIIYGTGMHNTERIAKVIEEGAKIEGVETALKNVDDADVHDVSKADAVAIGSPNYRDVMMPSVQKFLYKLAGVDLSNKVGLAFGSYGWGTEAIDDIDDILSSYGMEMMQKLYVKRISGEKELEESRRAGSQLACRIKTTQNTEVACVA
ncbi:MAG: FprA family A-type flavoprotein [Methanosarcinales archaeon]|nr:FprA family A-type flavoprotein [Methanosarcinales archaeon]